MEPLSAQQLKGVAIKPDNLAIITMVKRTDSLPIVCPLTATHSHGTPEHLHTPPHTHTLQITKAKGHFSQILQCPKKLLSQEETERMRLVTRSCNSPVPHMATGWQQETPDWLPEASSALPVLPVVTNIAGHPTT